MNAHSPIVLERIGQIASMSAELNDEHIKCNCIINGGEDYLHIDMFKFLEKGGLITARPTSYTVHLDEGIDDVETQLDWVIEAMEGYRDEPALEPIKPYDMVNEHEQNNLLELLRR